MVRTLSSDSNEMLFTHEMRGLSGFDPFDNSRDPRCVVAELECEGVCMSLTHCSAHTLYHKKSTSCKLTSHDLLLCGCMSGLVCLCLFSRV